MKKVFYSFLIFLLPGKILFAQSDWSKDYGLFSAPEIIMCDTASQTTPGYIIGGAHNYNTTVDVCLIRTNSSGAHMWDKSFDLGGADSTFSIKTLSDRSYLLTGNTVSGGNSDIFLMHTDGAGNSPTAKRITNSTSDERAYYLSRTSDGGSVLAGTADSAGNVDIWIVKLSSTYTVDWATKVIGANEDIAYCVKQTNDGGYIVAGSYGAAASWANQDAFLMKLTSGGNPSWAKRYAMDIGFFNDNEEFYGVTEMSDGKFVACGYLSKNSTSGRDYFFTVKVTSAGNFVWGKSYEFAGTDNPAMGITRSTIPGDKDSLVIWGLRSSTVYEMIKLDSAGTVKNAEEYPMSGFIPYYCKEPIWCSDRGIVFAHNAHASANFGLTKTKANLSNCYWGSAKAITTNSRTPTVTNVASGIKGSTVVIVALTPTVTTFSEQCRDDCNGNANCLNTIMPVDLISFTGENECEKNILQWSTASEKNNNYFSVERSVNAKDFETIGTIQGAGNSSTIINYEFTDEHLEILKQESETFYYRIKQIDFDGNYKYYSTIAVKLDCRNEIFVYPTLTNGLTHIYSGKNQTLSISVADALGREVISESTASAETTLDLSNYEKGIYFISIKTKNDFVVKKIVLQ